MISLDISRDVDVDDVVDINFVVKSENIRVDITLVKTSDNSKNWKRIVKAMDEGKRANIEFEACNGVVAIEITSENTTFTISKYGGIDQGCITVAVPTKECGELFRKVNDLEL